MRPDSLGIIGLGAIGGSIALEAAKADVARITGFAATPADGAAALKAGAVTALAQDAKGVVRAAEFVVLAVPPLAALKLLNDLAPELKATNAWCTDTASVKAPIVQLAQRLGLARFAGSHPLAGTHRSGFAAARVSMFDHGIVYVSAAEGGDWPAREVAHFWESVCGASPVTIDAARHDEMLAWTSHLPQSVASALAVALQRCTPPSATFGSGATDTTRLAASSAEMWRDILLLNRAAVLQSLEGMEDALGGLRRALETSDPVALTAWLERGGAWRRRLGQ
jgi:prephenate dehydrogenase